MQINKIDYGKTERKSIFIFTTGTRAEIALSRQGKGLLTGLII
ncbi:hypothetical protein [Chromobacterium piscinae]